MAEFDIKAEDYVGAYSCSDPREATRVVDTLNARHKHEKIFQLIQQKTKLKTLKRHDGVAIPIKDGAKELPAFA